MASNNLRPEEWQNLVSRIRTGDPTVAQALTDRERRFDNFFATGQYKPVATQNATLTTANVANETYGHWIRIGNWVWVQASFRSTSSGTASNRILLSVPPELLIASPTFQSNNVDITIPRGQFTWVDDSTAPDGIITGTAVSYANTHIAGITSGVQGSAESTIYIGEGAFNQVVSGDWVKMNVNYLTNNAMV
jgi:hypothetical protein